MTSSLRRKRRTTVPATATPVRTAASLWAVAALGLLSVAPAARAQSPYGIAPGGAGKAPASPYQLQGVAQPAVPPPPAAPAPVAAPPVEAPPPALGMPDPNGGEKLAEEPALHFTKQAVARNGGAAEAPAAFQPDIMLQQSAMQDAGIPQPRQKLGADQVRTSQSAPTGGGTDDQSYEIQLEPVGSLRLFRLESEVDLFRRIRQDAVNRPNVGFESPVQPIISTEQFAGRQWAPSTEVVEPGYVCYGRLLFEDRNSERYGWDLGFIQPFVSLGLYYYDVIFLPYHSFEDPCRCFECNAGHCLPGDPVPYLLYPPKLSVAGAVAEASVVLGLVAVFP